MDDFAFLQKQLLSYGRSHGRTGLPWRAKGLSPYHIWVSEVMLQQTQVSRVVDYYIRFIERFPDVETLSRATWEEFLPYYQGLGYYRRGENMRKTARVVAEDYMGKFPTTKRELLALPGIGEYTASAILSFGMRKQVLAFDTNMQRVFGRYFFGAKDARIDVAQLEEGLTVSAREFNGAVMDFASDVCTKKPDCGTCPLRKRCAYNKTGGKREVVAKKKAIAFPSKQAQTYLWLHKDHKEYYSPSVDTYKVFVLPMGYNTREGVKQYFAENYNLELAVRPPHEKTYVNDKPTLFVNAQILLGTHEFGIFSKQDAEDFKRRNNL